MKTSKAAYIATASAVVVASLASCGPKQPPATSGTSEGHLTLEPGQAAAFKAAAEAEVIKKLIAEWKGLIDDANTAIDTQDGDLFWSVFTKESQELFTKMAEIDMALSGTENETPTQHILKQQKDFNVVYSLEDEDHVAHTATLVAVIRTTGEQARFPLRFVEKDGGGWLADYTAVLAMRLENLEESFMRKLVADLNKALDSGDSAAFSAVVTEATASGCPDFMHVLPPVKANPKKPVTLADQLAAIKKAGLYLVIDSFDTLAMKASVSGKSGDEVLGPVSLSFVEDAGEIRMDATSACSPAPAK